MKVQSIQQQIPNENSIKPQFKGAVDTTMRFLATNQAVGANGVDLCFMVIPRSANDGIKRGPAAGWETGRREIMGTINDSCVGLFGAGSGFLIAYALDKKYGTDINRVFTAPETLEILAQNKANQIKNNKSQSEYIKETLSSLKAYNPNAAGSDKDGYVKLSKETIEETAKLIDEALKEGSGVTVDSWTSGKNSNVRNAIINKITENTGAQSNYVLESTDAKIKSTTNLKSFLNDIFLVTDSFEKDRVKSAFNEQIQSGKTIKENAFIKSVSKFMRTRAGMGFAISSAIGLSVQPINMYLTKLKTGSDGFVGVEGRSKDTSTGFLGLKALSSAAFFSMILSTLDMKPWQFTPRKFMDKMEFKGKMPTINQLKGIYGITIISRVFSARDKDELREVLTKDTLGYLSWLVLGDIINRIVAERLDKKVLNFKNGSENDWYGKKMYNASLRTRDEIIIETLAKNGIDTTKLVNGKLEAKSFSDMCKELEKLSPEIQKATRKHLRTLNVAQAAGYIFSGLVLGLGIPNLNIYITNKLDKKRKAKEAEQALKLNA